jgi:hypothetical protein
MTNVMGLVGRGACCASAREAGLQVVLIGSTNKTNRSWQLGHAVVLGQKIEKKQMTGWANRG